MTADPMHAKLIRRAQRQAACASRQTNIQDARRLARMEVEIDAIRGQMTADSILMGTASVQLAPGEITAQTRRSDEEALLELAKRLWPANEYVAIIQAEGGQS